MEYKYLKDDDMEYKYLKINFYNNDFQRAVSLVAPAIQETLCFYSDIDFEHDTTKTEKIFNTFRELILAQLNLSAALNDINYNYIDEVKNIDFSIVSQDNIESWNNWKTVYFKLFEAFYEGFGSYFFR